MQRAVDLFDRGGVQEHLHPSDPLVPELDFGDPYPCHLWFVEFLNAVFSTFDGIVADLGHEKIKTVGDEFMVAAGVPPPRSDHARALAHLALRIRDYVEANRFEGADVRG